MYLAPKPGDEVTVLLNEQMVRDMRSYNDADPAATNHELADRVESLLLAGHDRTRGICETGSAFHQVTDGSQEWLVMEGHQLVRMRCRELTGGELVDRKSTRLNSSHLG